MSIEKFNFTKAYQELEEINEWFQQEDIDLDEGLNKYRRGLELIKKCRDRLKDAENQFHDIKKEFSIQEKEVKVNEIEKDIRDDGETKEVSGEDIPF